MKSYGPKPLIELGTGNIISKQLTVLQHNFPKAEIIIVTGFEHARVSRYVRQWQKENALASSGDIILVENPYYIKTNVALSIYDGVISCKHNNILVVYGDLVFNNDTFADFSFDKTTIFIDNKQQFRDCEVGVNIYEDEVFRFAYGLPTKWAHILFLSGDNISYFLDEVERDKTKKKFCFEILNNMIESGLELHAFEPANMNIVEVDTSNDIDRTHKVR